MGSAISDHFREIVALSIVALFAFAYIHNPDDKLMQGALIAAFATAYGYYLGSSKRSTDKPTPVEVTNDANKPVPVEPAQ